jgi:hypothetical protein
MILQRITPESINAEFSFDDAVETLISLLNTISASRLESLDRLSNYLEPQTAAQMRVIVYFRLCGRLRMAEQMAAFYDESKNRGVEFTPLMYNFALSGVSNDPSVFSSFSSKVLGDMAKDHIVPDIGIMKNIMRGWFACRNVKMFILCFRYLERR